MEITSIRLYHYVKNDCHRTDIQETDNCPTTMYTQFCIEFQENSTDGLVADTTSQTERERERERGG